MKNINTASLDCGIDGVNIKFLSEFETEQELYYFQRSNSNRTIKYGLLKKLGLKNGLVEYSIFINLPQTIRNSNIQPYSFVDCTKYMRVYQMLTEQLNDIFDFDISDLKVTGIECSFSYTLRDNTLLQPMLNYICRAFISKNTPLHVYVKGTQSRRYKKSKIYCDCINVQSFRTSRSSDCLGSYKCYNKLMEELEHATDEKEHNELEQRIANESILRFEWVERQKQCGRSNNTISKYESDYIRFFEGDRLENMDIRDIDEVVLSQFIERLLKSKEIPYRALQAMIGYVNGVFKKSVKDGIIKKSDNPCDEVDLPLYKQYCKRETIKTSAERTFSKKEKNSLLDILATNHETKPNYIPSYAVELSLYTGMRVGELSGLMWEDIDTEQNIIHIRHSEKHDRKNNEYYISLPKNGKIRDFPLTPEIEDILNRVKKVELKNNWLTEYVFSNDKGRVHARTISECMRLKTSGTDFHNVKCIHTSRRTVNSEYAKAGMPATARASIIGNTERVNEQNYTYDISEMDYKRSIISMVNRATKAM